MGSPDASQDSTETKTKQCPHLAASFAVEVSRVSMLKKYKAAVAWAATRRTDIRVKQEPPSKKRKTSAASSASSMPAQMQLPSCGTCGLTLHRPFICLDCSYGGCWHGGHVLGHLKDLGHRFCAFSVLLASILLILYIQARTSSRVRYSALNVTI